MTDSTDTDDQHTLQHLIASTPAATRMHELHTEAEELLSRLARFSEAYYRTERDLSAEWSGLDSDIEVLKELTGNRATGQLINQMMGHLAAAYPCVPTFVPEWTEGHQREGSAGA